MQKRVASLLVCVALAANAAEPRLNILFITADDMNYNTPGFTGNKLPGITPNLDRLASQGLWFVNAHVTVGVCQPSRECLMTGRYPHRNGAIGFYPVRADVPTLQEQLKAAGYYLGIMGKTSHLAPPAKFPWDFMPDGAEIRAGRAPSAYYTKFKEFLQKAKAAGKPFFYMANSHDPHRPYAGSEQEQQKSKGKKNANKPRAAQVGDESADSEGTYPPPDRIFKPGEVSVPGFLPELPDIRREAAQYSSSAHRFDQTLGEVLRALKEEGLEETTLVMFLSDNGISMPFAKSNCYLTSTRTPWLVRWPGKVKPGTKDTTHFISGIDYMPTILEAAGLPLPAGMDGRSFLPLLTGGSQDGRDHAFTCYNDTSARKSYPMRCLQNARFGYIYNAWSTGENTYRAESMSGLTYKAMVEAAKAQPAVAARVDLLLHRVPEELYDLQSDPNALTNLVADAKCLETLQQMRKDMLAWMAQTEDPLLDGYQKRVQSARGWRR